MYTRIIRWSREDGCYVGSLPEICGNCCHGDTVEAVCRQLDEIAEDWVGMEEPPPLPPTPKPTPRPPKNCG